MCDLFTDSVEKAVFMLEQYLKIFFKSENLKVCFFILYQVKYFLLVLSFQVCNFFFLRMEHISKKKSILIQNVLIFLTRKILFLFTKRRGTSCQSHYPREKWFQAKLQLIYECWS